MDLKTTPAVFQNRVREARQAKGWSMTELAARAGMTRQNVSLLELHPGHRAKDRTMDALADALGVDRAWLFYVVPSDEKGAA